MAGRWLDGFARRRAGAAVRWAGLALLLLVLSLIGAAAATAAKQAPGSRGAIPFNPAKLSPAERDAFATAKRRHGLPPAVPLPAWAKKPGEHPYFAPAPTAWQGSGGRRSDSARVSRPLGGSGPNNHLEVREGEVPPLYYMNGIVEHNPKVDVIFWGKAWNEPTGASLRQNLLNFYNGLSNSPEQGILTQYFDPTSRISQQVSVASFTDERVTAPSNINAEAVATEVKYAEGQLGAHNVETQYDILPAPGSTYAFGGRWCAEHDYDSEGAIWAFIPYAGDEPYSNNHHCQSYYGNGSAAAATMVMASHEYSESATDPLWETQPGWQDLEGEEIADLCATPGDEIRHEIVVQGWYDDHQNACSESDQAPPHILAVTGNPTHVTEHTGTLTATINPESSGPTTYQFEYGATESYGSKAPASEVNVGAGRENISVQVELAKLEVEHAYHYRVVAKSPAGTTYGEDRIIHPSHWIRQSTPNGAGWAESSLTGVSCGSATSCIAVGAYHDRGIPEAEEPYRALAVQLSAGRWNQLPVPHAGGERFPELKGISCSSTVTCTAVGRVEVGGTTVPLIERWNGATWSKETANLPAETVEAELTDVSCSTTYSCMAIGQRTTSTGQRVNYSNRWSQGSWTSLETPTASEALESGRESRLKRISCSGPEVCMAVGWYNTGEGARAFSELWKSGAWTLEKHLWDGGLEGVTCTSSTYCVAVGERYSPYEPAVETWNGAKWTAGTTALLADVKGGDLEGISCVSRTNCTAVGSGYSTVNRHALTLAENWNGSSWKEESTPRDSDLAFNELICVSCTEVAGCITVGESKAGGRWESLVETRHSSYVSPSFTSGFGSTGSGGGQANSPVGLAVDASGNVWVADRHNSRMDEYGPSGEFILTFGKEVNKTKVESGGSEAEKNLCTAASGNVCQSGNAGNGNGQFNEPRDVAIGSNGYLWVTNGGGDNVQEYTPKGEFVARFGVEGTGAGQFSEPWGIAISPEGNLWVSDARYYRVEEFNSSGGFIREVHGVGQGGTGPAEFFHPTGIAIDKEGYVWVVDCRNNRVQALSATGQYVSQFGTKGAGEGQIDEPGDLAVKPSGDLLVADALNNRVEEFSPNGEFVMQYGSYGTGKEQFREPEGIALGANGTEYVSDTDEGRIEKWYQPALPEATIQAATEVKGTEATLNGLVNPGSVATSYRFEYGTTSNYGTSVPIPNGSAGSGTEAVSEHQAVTGLSFGTTYHYRIVAESAAGTARSEDKTFTTLTATSVQLTALPVTDPFNATNSAISNFGSNWSALGWAGGIPAKGEDSTTGWGPSVSYPTVNGAYYNPVINTNGMPVAAVATMAANPGLAERFFSLWLDMSSPASTRNGYQLTFTDVSAGLYTVKLSKWSAGTQTVLATKSNYSFANGNSLALVDRGTTVSAFTDTGSGFIELINANDSSYEGGNVAVEGSGGSTRLTKFKAGALQESAAGMNSALQVLPIDDSFTGSELPLSDGNAFAALSWAGGTAPTGQVSSGWGPWDTYPTINGAYWQKASFADSGTGDAVAATLSKNPGSTSRHFSLWLNMPSPNTARSGYELRFTETASGVYGVALVRWQTGTETALASTSNLSLPLNSQFALVDKAGTVSAWTKTGTEYTQLLSAADATFTSGYAGIEGSGNGTRLKELRIGPLAPF